MTFRATSPRADSAGAGRVAPASVPARFSLSDWARMWFVAFLIVMAECEYRAYVRREERRRLRK